MASIGAGVPEQLRRLAVLLARLDDVDLEYIAVDDDKKDNRLHARYLLSLRGGIRFDQGFQKLRKGVQFDVAPIGESILDDLVKIFIEEENDLRIVERISL